MHVEQIRQAQALKIELNYNQTVFRYLYELRREATAHSTTVGLTHRMRQCVLSRINVTASAPVRVFEVLEYKVILA